MFNEVHVPQAVYLLRIFKLKCITNVHVCAGIHISSQVSMELS